MRQSEQRIAGRRRAALLAALLVCACGPAAPPNAILIVIDTLRADHLGGYGYARDTTPNLDRLMREGVRFDAAISNSSWSAPSHATLATGTSTPSHAVLNFSHALPEGIEPVAAVFQRSGYATGLFSTHFALHNGVQGLDAGFDRRQVERNDRDGPVLVAALEWIRGVDRPFFLQLVLMGPHAPYAKYPKAYDEEHFTDVPPGGEREFDFTETVWVGEGGIPRSVRLEGRRDVGFYVNRYDRAIRYTDALVGAFLDRLREEGRLDHALVVVVSDHGEGLGEHGIFAHELHLYDFLVRVPLIVSFPGVVPSGVVWSPVVPHVDVAPTMLGLAGLPVPAWMDGRDLSEPLRRGEPPPDEVLATGAYRLRGFERYMVRSAALKLIYDARSGARELYDLRADPHERVNLLAPGRGEPPPGYARLARELGVLRERHAALRPRRPGEPLAPAVVEELKALGYVEED